MKINRPTATCLGVLLTAILAICPTGRLAAEDTTTENTTHELEGYASWYGGKFQGRLTANGEVFDTNLSETAGRWRCQSLTGAPSLTVA